MRCVQVQKHSSAYLDGDLDADRSSALRGHLRGCEACATLLADEQALVRAAGDVEPLDPPAALWQKISDRLGDEEVADAGRAPTLLRLRGVFWRLAPFRAHILVGATVCVLVVALMAKRTLEQPIAPDASLSSVTPPAMSIANIGASVFAPAADGDTETHLEAAIREIREADRRYLAAIAELREITDADRDTWTDAQRARFDATVTRFETRATQLLDEGGQHTASSEKRDALYDHYRKHIAFLEGVAFGQLSLLAEASR